MWAVLLKPGGLLDKEHGNSGKGDCFEKRHLYSVSHDLGFGFGRSLDPRRNAAGTPCCNPYPCDGTGGRD